MGVYKFLIRHVMHEEIRYFSYKGHERQEERPHFKTFQYTQASLLSNILWIFSDEKNFSQYQMVNSQNNRWFALSPQDVLMVMKTKYPVPIMVFGIGHLRWWRCLSFHLPTWFHIQLGGLHQVTEEVSVTLDREGGYWKTLHQATEFCIMSHKQENQVLAVRKYL